MLLLADDQTKILVIAAMLIVSGQLNLSVAEILDAIKGTKEEDAYTGSR